VTKVYIKTPAGLKEIEQRSREVPPRVRTLLILVDGRRTDAELAAMVPQFEVSLAALLQGGLIALVDMPPVPATPPPAPRLAPAPPPAAPQVAAGQVDPVLRREAVRAVNDLLGPQGDSLAMRIERVTTADELVAVLTRSVGLIADARGQRAAEAFAQRFLPASPPA